jgi:hypothetical protein
MWAFLKKALSLAQLSFSEKALSSAQIFFFSFNYDQKYYSLITISEYLFAFVVEAALVARKTRWFSRKKAPRKKAVTISAKYKLSNYLLTSLLNMPI